MKLVAPFMAKVVGVSFTDGYPENLYALNDKVIQEGHREEGVAAVLIRNPDNAHDSNVIEVHVPAIGMIGHINRHVAARLAPEMDEGVRWHAEVMDVLIHPDHEDNPGISIRCERAPEEES